MRKNTNISLYHLFFIIKNHVHNKYGTIWHSKYGTLQYHTYIKISPLIHYPFLQHHPSCNQYTTGTLMEENFSFSDTPHMSEIILLATQDFGCDTPNRWALAKIVRIYYQLGTLYPSWGQLRPFAFWNNELKIKYFRIK